MSKVACAFAYPKPTPNFFPSMFSALGFLYRVCVCTTSAAQGFWLTASGQILKVESLTKMCPFGALDFPAVREKHACSDGQRGCPMACLHAVLHLNRLNFACDCLLVCG